MKMAEGMGRAMGGRYDVVIVGAGIAGSALAAALAPAGLEILLLEAGALPEALPPLAELDAQAADISLADLADVQGTQDLLIDLGIIE